MAPRRHHSISSPAAYRFIFDPKHVETLSGRVRAACGACRHRKCKCSGGIPCQPCVSRGIECHGPVGRRNTRPKSPSAQESFIQLKSRSFQYGMHPHNPASQATSNFSSPSSSNDLFSPLQTGGTSPLKSSPRPSSWMEKAGPFDLTGGFGALEATTPEQQMASSSDELSLLTTSLDVTQAMSRFCPDLSKVLHTSYEAYSPAAANLECLARNLEQRARALRTLAIQQHSCSMESACCSIANWATQNCISCAELGIPAEEECLEIATLPWNGRHDSVGDNLLGVELSQVQTL